MKGKRLTQCERLEKYMREVGSVTTFEALTQLGILRLGARISEMRKSGLKIKDKWEIVYNCFDEPCTVKRYFLD